MEMQESLAGALKNKLVWAVASHADSSLRHVRKALIAIESAVCEYEGFEARDRRWVDIQDSLATRRLYGQFRRAILRGGEPQTHEQLTASLKSAATRIAILRGLEIYPFLRIDDRLTIRRLQKRIAAWLDGGADSSQESGLRLWEDLISFARLVDEGQRSRGAARARPASGDLESTVCFLSSSGGRSGSAPAS